MCEFGGGAAGCWCAGGGGGYGREYFMVTGMCLSGWMVGGVRGAGTGCVVGGFEWWHCNPHSAI